MSAFSSCVVSTKIKTCSVGMFAVFLPSIALLVSGCANSSQGDPRISEPIIATSTSPPTKAASGFITSTAESTSTIRSSTPRRLFTTSTSTTRRPLTEDELILEQYCALLGTTCSGIGFSGAWFEEGLGTFTGKETLRSSLRLTFRKAKQSLASHVEAGMRVPHCGVTRTLAALSVMRDFHSDPSKRDVAVFSARKLAVDNTEHYCETTVYVLLNRLLSSSADREIIHRIHLRLIIFASLYVEPPLIVSENIRNWSGSFSEEKLNALDQVIWQELNKAFVEFPKYNMNSLRTQLSGL